MGEIAASSSSCRKGGWAITLEEHRRRQDARVPAPPSRGTRSDAPVVVHDWRDQALCRAEKMSVDYFFPGENDQHARIRIPAYCRRCPVRQECGDWATLEGIPWGWWGGLSPQQRTNRVFDVRTATWKPREHGFQRYRYGSHGKNPENGCRCEVCTEAARERWAREQGRVRK